MRQRRLKKEKEAKIAAGEEVEEEEEPLSKDKVFAKADEVKNLPNFASQAKDSLKKSDPADKLREKLRSRLSHISLALCFVSYMPTSQSERNPQKAKRTSEET
jgi:hypothetical protein